MTIWDFLHEAGFGTWLGIFIAGGAVLATIERVAYYFRRHR